MRTVLQRASRASVRVADVVIAEFFEPGLVALIGVTHDNDEATARKTAQKIAELRILKGELSVLETQAPVIVVSQFTLYASTRKGRRPSWSKAAPGEQAEGLLDVVVAELRRLGVTVETGKFGAEMAVELVNDGPFTIIYDTAE